MLKVRREGKDQKKNFSLKQQAPFAKPLPSLVKPAMEASQDNPEWLISEDWALLQVMMSMQTFTTQLLQWKRYISHFMKQLICLFIAQLSDRLWSSCWSCLSTWQSCLLPTLLTGIWWVTWWTPAVASTAHPNSVGTAMRMSSFPERRER